MTGPSAELLARMSETCKRCGAGVVWGLTPQGEAFAVDAQRVVGGNVALVEQRGELRVSFVAGAADVERYVPHRGICTKKPEAPRSAGDAPAEPAHITLNFGKHRGKALGAVPSEYLKWLRAQRREELLDETKEHRRYENEQLIEAIGAVLRAKGKE